MYQEIKTLTLSRFRWIKLNQKIQINKHTIRAKEMMRLSLLIIRNMNRASLIWILIKYSAIDIYIIYINILT